MPRKRSTKTVASSRSGNSAGPRLVRSRAIDEADDQHRDLDDHEELDVEPEAVEDFREGVLEDAPGEERLADLRPAGAGQDPGGEAAEDDDRGDRGDRLPAPRLRRFAASRSRRRSLMTAVSVTRPRILTAAGTAPGRGALGAQSQFGGAGGLAHPALVELPSSPELAQLFDRLGDAGGQRRVLGQQGAPLVAAGGAELADHGRVGDLGGGQVERGRQVDDDGVDLFVLQRRDDVVGAVEDLRLLARVDLCLRPRRGWWCRSGRRSWRPCRSASEVALAASESFSATTAWLAV